MPPGRTKKRAAAARSTRRVPGIAGALELLDDGEPAKALTALVGTWAATPYPRLGDAIDRLDATLPKRPLDPAQQRKWITACNAADTASLGNVLAALDGGSIDDLRARVKALAKRPRDPRIASALLALVREPHYTSNTSRPMWADVFFVLALVADPRVLDEAPAIASGWAIRQLQKDWMAVRLDEVVAAIPPAPPEAASDTRLLDRLEATLATRAAPSAAPANTRSRDAMLAAIYDDPFDDALRSVYADALIEAGDPRGEFIALQLQPPTDETRARTKKLLAKHEREWLGPLAPVVAKAGVVFTRGFVSSCTVKFKNESEVRKYGSLPAWATVERLEHSVPGAAAGDQYRWIYWIDPVMRALRDVTITRHTLDLLVDAPHPWRIERLVARIADVDELARLGATDKLPALTALEVKAAPHGWLARTRLAHQLREFTVTADPRDLASWLGELAQLPQLERVSPLHAWTFTRDAQRAFTVATAAARWARTYELARELEQLPADTLSELTVTYSGHPVGIERITDDNRDELVTVARRQRHLTRLDLTAIGGEVVTYTPVQRRTHEFTRPPFYEIWAVAFAGDNVLVRDRHLVYAIAPDDARRTLAELPDAERLAVACDGATVAICGRAAIHVHDVATGARVRRIDFDAAVSTALFRDDGRLVVSCYDRRVHLVDPATGATLASTSLPNRANYLADLGNGRILANGGALSAPLVVAFDGTKPRVFAKRPAADLAVSPGGRVALAPSVHVFEADGSEIGSSDDKRGADWLAFVDDDHIVGIAGIYVMHFAAPRWQLVREIRRPAALNTAALSADRTRLAIATADTVEVWLVDAKAKQPLRTIR